MTIGTRALGTTATTSLTAIQYFKVSDGLQALPGGTNQLTAAAIAAINNLIKWDSQSGLTNQDFDPNTPGQPFINALSNAGQLVIPSRGILKVREGDVIAVDTQTGWPILVSAAAANSNPAWVLSGVTG